jgi:two-component system sensor histidine kinase AgrC
MINLLFIIFSNLFHTIIIYRFINLFFSSKKFNLSLTLFNFFLYFLASGFIYFLFHNISLYIIMNYLAILLLTFLYETSNVKRISSTTIIFMLNMSCHGLVYILFFRYEIGHSVIEMYSILTNMLLFLVEIIAERLFKDKEAFSISLHKWLALLCIPIISGILIVIQFLSLDEQFKTIITVLGILILNILLFHLYGSVFEHYKERYHKTLLERKIAAYSNQLVIIEKAQKNYDSIKHDMSHHIRMIKGYLEDHNLDSISKYLNSINNEYFVDTFFVNSGNMEIDSILNYMLSIANNSLKDVNYNIRIPANMPYDALTLNIVLGNLLENAICASQESKEQFLKVSLLSKQGLLYIDISNSHSGNLKIKNGHFITTKNNLELHGIGLGSVKEILSKNNSTLSIDYNHNKFEVHVLYYLPT